MNAKVNLTVGVDATGNQQVLYVGPDGQKAKDVYEAAINGSHPGVETVYLFIRPSHDRRRDVVRSAPVAPVVPEVVDPNAAAVSEPKAPQAKKPKKQS